MTAPAVYASGLRREFGGVVAVDSVDLVVQPGEIYGFLGPNGAGKTTCVRMLCTLLRPTMGEIVVAGHHLEHSPNQIRRSIGVALQDASLDPKLTGRQMLDHQGRLFGLRRRDIRLRIGQLSRLIDVDALDRRIDTYSGGMRRRLDLAAAMIHEPEVVFFDEPTTGLDPDSRAAVWGEIQRINTETQTTVFLTTQYLDEADALAHRIGILRHGRLAAEGSPEELKRRIGGDVITVSVDADPNDAVATAAGVDGIVAVEHTSDTLVARAPNAAAIVGPLAVALDQAGFRVESLHMQSPSLDDVYFSVTGERFDEEVDG